MCERGRAKAALPPSPSPPSPSLPQAIMGEVHPSIPLLCLCGNHDVGNRPTASSIETFKQDFGDDYFGFWVDKMKGVVINSNVYFDPTEVRLFIFC